MINKDDTISREAALSCFHDWIDKNGDLHTPDEMAEYRAIERLPSVGNLSREVKNVNQELENSNDCISRQAAIDGIVSFFGISIEDEYGSAVKEVITQLPPAQPEGWMEQNKDRILKAGMEGREVEFRIGGRLFSIREKAQ